MKDKLIYALLLLGIIVCAAVVVWAVYETVVYNIEKLS